MRFKLLLFALLLAMQSIEAQTFTKVFSSDRNLLLMNHVAPISSGGWYASGIERDVDGITAFLTKFDANGNLLWAKRPDATRDARALVALNDGSALFFNNNSGFQGYFDASVVQIGASGNFITETIWGNANDQDDWFDAKKLASGEVLAIGMSRESSSIEERILLAKFSATGQLIWEKTYTGGLFGRFAEILPLPSGDFYALGQNYTSGQNNGMLGKFNAAGDLLWVKTYNFGSLFSYFLAGQALSDGSVSVASYLTSQNGLDITLNLLNINADGAVTNQNAFQGLNDLSPVKMGLLNNDTLLIAANTTHQTASLTEYNPVILQVSPQGDLLGTLAFGSEAQEFGYDAFFMDRQVVLCGVSDTSVDGTARRALLSKSSIQVSCCEKNASISVVAPPPLPLVNNIFYTSSTVPSKQNQTIAINDFVLSETVSCQNPDGALLLPPDTTICVGDTIQINASSNLPGQILWNTGATTRSLLVNAAGTYSVTLSGECGIANDTIEVIAIGNRVSAQVAQVDEVCPGERVVLAASGGTEYEWFDASGNSVFTTANPTILASISTNYAVVVADGGCRDTALVAVNVFNPPSISAVQDVTIRLGGQARLSATGASTYNWLPPAGLSCSDCPSPLASPTQTTTYTVFGTDANGCADTATVTVFVEQPCPFYIPNVFHPASNSGAGNDRFGIFSATIEPTGFQLRVYSRWGELVFESNNPDITWDGSFRNEQAPPGVYLYLLRMTTCDGPIQASGDVTLVR
jgi:gliding motility-associated-like protein